MLVLFPTMDFLLGLQNVYCSSAFARRLRFLSKLAGIYTYSTTYTQTEKQISGKIHQNSSLT